MNVNSNSNIFALYQTHIMFIFNSNVFCLTSVNSFRISTIRLKLTTEEFRIETTLELSRTAFLRLPSLKEAVERFMLVEKPRSVMGRYTITFSARVSSVSHMYNATQSCCSWSKNHGMIMLSCRELREFSEVELLVGGEDGGKLFDPEYKFCRNDSRS